MRMVRNPALLSFLLLFLFASCKSETAAISEEKQIESYESRHDTIRDTLQIFSTIHFDTLNRTIYRHDIFARSTLNSESVAAKKDTLFISQIPNEERKASHEGFNHRFLYLVLGFSMAVFIFSVLPRVLRRKGD